MADIHDSIDADAQKAKTTEVDGTRITRRSTTEQIDADKHLASSEATRTCPARGLMFNKLSPPGTA